MPDSSLIQSALHGYVVLQLGSDHLVEIMSDLPAAAPCEKRKHSGKVHPKAKDRSYHTAQSPRPCNSGLPKLQDPSHHARRCNLTMTASGRPMAAANLIPDEQNQARSAGRVVKPRQKPRRRKGSGGAGRLRLCT